MRFRPTEFVLCAAACALLTLPLAAAAARSSAFTLAGPQVKSSQDENPKQDRDAEAELHKAIASAGNDRAALVKNLTAYLQRFPDAPRKGNVYQALIEACQQLRDVNCAVDYAERLIAVEPDNSEIMMLATDLLQQRGDDASLTRAAGYATRVLDRVEKAVPADKPPQQSVAEWRDHQNQMRTALYAVRGNIEKSQRDYDAAVKDLRTSFSIYPNAVAAMILGEIDEIQNDIPAAIDEYSLAFVLPKNGPAGKVDRLDVRRKLGNDWRRVHGSEKGLGEAILAAYDRVSAKPPGDASNPLARNTARNKDAKDVFDFVLSRPNGAPLSLAPFRGKVVALSFWATWCSPCRVVEPIFNQLAKGYAGNPKVEFLAVNTDEDRALVAPFAAKEKWTLPIAYSDGLDALLDVETLPTIIVLDSAGKIIYRTSEFTTRDFSAKLSAAIDASLASH
jgi:thiol-disulfide isomerase/thioredoxin